MELRKVYKVGNAVVISVPVKFVRITGIGPGDHIEMFLADARTLVIRKHDVIQRRRSNNG